MSVDLKAPDLVLLQRIRDLASPKDVSRLLEIDYRRLKYHLYMSDPASRYASFSISKRAGGTRQISAPITPLKILQRKLAHVLGLAYEPKAPVHGFVIDRGILTNAKMHTRKWYLLNLDIKDFFPSINFGRVRGMFMAFPFHLNPSVATVLAQICCHDDKLPQGAPTSPIVSNLICARMDSELRILAMENRSTYTRYADDISISTTLRKFPGRLASILPDGSVELGEDLTQLIERNGFEVNYGKVRLQSKYQRQEVTGLKVNRFPNVRRSLHKQIRAMLNDWDVRGLQSAEARHFELFNSHHLSPFKERPSFKRIVKGKIDFLGMVKGKDDASYRRFLYKYAKLDPDYAIRFEVGKPARAGNIGAVVFTEGKTDWQHLKAALTAFQKVGKFVNLEITFKDTEEGTGNTRLLTLCSAFAQSPGAYPEAHIFLFDRDDPKILRGAFLVDASYHSWGKNVYSLGLPIPPHRQQTPLIAIELLYSDADIRRTDEEGRRLFLSREFHQDSGRHLEEDLNYRYPPRLRTDRLLVIDDDVFDIGHRNVALPKSSFAKCVLELDKRFEGMNFSAFEPIFEDILEIATIASK
jgi:RNA-directed DNA polymerase